MSIEYCAYPFLEEVSCVMYQIHRERKPLEAIMFDFMNLLLNTFFMMRLYENAQDKTIEKEFISRSYI